MDPQGILKAFPKRKKIHADPSSNALAKIPKREAGDARGEPVRPQTSYTGILSLPVFSQNQIAGMALPVRGQDLFVHTLYQFRFLSFSLV